MFKELKPALLMLIVMSLITGALYPALVTVIAQLAMPGPANGSLLEADGRIVGSRLIGQAFSDPKYFWSRRSATAPVPYNAGASSGSNQGPLNPALAAAVSVRMDELKAADPTQSASIPVDLVTASGSGLDPHISPAAARYQAPRIARLRGLAPAALQQLIDDHTEGRQFGFLGEPRVNVLALNLALARLATRQ